MTHQITWSEPALNNAARFLTDDPDGLRALFHAVDDLAHHPYPPASTPYGSPRLRRLHTGRYRALYEITDTHITVIHLGRIP